MANTLFEWVVETEEAVMCGFEGDMEGTDSVCKGILVELIQGIVVQDD